MTGGWRPHTVSANTGGENAVLSTSVCAEHKSGSEVPRRSWDSSRDDWQLSHEEDRPLRLVLKAKTKFDMDSTSIASELAVTSCVWSKSVVARRQSTSGSALSDSQKDADLRQSRLRFVPLSSSSVCVRRRLRQRADVVVVEESDDAFGGSTFSLSSSPPSVLAQSSYADVTEDVTVRLGLAIGAESSSTLIWLGSLSAGSSSWHGAHITGENEAPFAWNASSK